METSNETDGKMRYLAFVSYNRTDSAWAKKVHRSIEAYKLPASLGRSHGLDGTRKLGTLFRDDDELSASSDLGQSLQNALDESKSLVVVCSPRSARSKWVREEISYFRRNSSTDRIFAIIVDGTPEGSKDHSHAVEEQDCFPPELYGDESDENNVPFAIDFRKDNFEKNLVRLIAGILGIRFDELWGRHKRMRRRQRAYQIGASLLTGLVVGGLAVDVHLEANKDALSSYAADLLSEGKHQSAASIALASINEFDFPFFSLTGSASRSDQSARQTILQSGLANRGVATFSTGQNYSTAYFLSSNQHIRIQTWDSESERLVDSIYEIFTQTKIAEWKTTHGVYEDRSRGCLVSGTRDFVAYDYVSSSACSTDDAIEFEDDSSSMGATIAIEDHSPGPWISDDRTLVRYLDAFGGIIRDFVGPRYIHPVGRSDGLVVDRDFFAWLLVDGDVTKLSKVVENGIMISPGGEVFTCDENSDGTIWSREGERTSSFTPCGELTQVWFDQGSSKIVLRGGQPRSFVYDGVTGEEITATNLRDVRISADGSLLLGTSAADVSVLDLKQAGVSNYGATQLAKFVCSSEPAWLAKHYAEPFDVDTSNSPNKERATKISLSRPKSVCEWGAAAGLPKRWRWW